MFSLQIKCDFHCKIQIKFDLYGEIKMKFGGEITQGHKMGILFCKTHFFGLLMIFKITHWKKNHHLHLCALQDWEQEDTPWDTTPIIHRHLVRNKMGSLPSIFLVKIIFHLLALTFSHDFLKQRTLVVDRRHLTRNIYFVEQFSFQNQIRYYRINFKLLLIVYTTAFSWCVEFLWKSNE